MTNSETTTRESPSQSPVHGGTEGCVGVGGRVNVPVGEGDRAGGRVADAVASRVGVREAVAVGVCATGSVGVLLRSLVPV